MNMKKLDLSGYVGKKFGNWTVVSTDVTKKSRDRKVSCKCGCGNVSEVVFANLARGKSTKCNLCRLDNFKQEKTTHDLYRSKLYRVYKSMINRCHDTGYKGYKDYGARGI